MRQTSSMSRRLNASLAAMAWLKASVLRGTGLLQKYGSAASFSSER
jgi:hypothetical protein